MKRRYDESLELDHDLYKLEVGKMKKNTSLPHEPPNYVDVEHCHFFHTVDSDGKTQTQSTPTGGHFHLVELKITKNDVPQIVRVSEPMIEINQRDKYGRSAKRNVQANIDDMHSHETTYIKSTKIKLRQMNPQTAAILAKEANLVNADTN